MSSRALYKYKACIVIRKFVLSIALTQDNLCFRWIFFFESILGANICFLECPDLHSIVSGTK